MSAFDIGLQDAWHPVSLATLLVLTWLLLRYARTFITYFFAGLVFFCATYHFHLLLIAGGLDAFLTVNGVSLAIKIFYLSLGVLFFYYGCYLWRLWWRARFKGVPTPVKDRDKVLVSKKEIMKSLGVILLAYGLGALFVFTSSVITQDYAAYVMILDAKSQGDEAPDKTIIMSYFLGSIIFLYVVWVVLGFSYMDKVAAVIKRFQPTCTIIVSASFMAVSIGLILQFIK